MRTKEVIHEEMKYVMKEEVKGVLNNLNAVFDNDETKS